MARRVWSIIGMVLDIHDVASLIRRVFVSGGGSVVIVGIANAVKNMPTLSLILIAVGGFLILIAALPNLARMLRLFRQPKQSISKRESLIFPYIQTVSASPIVYSGEKYLDLAVYFPSALPIDLDLIEITGQFGLRGSPPIVGGETKANALEPQPLRINKQSVSNLSGWQLELTERLVEDVRIACKNCMPVTIFLKLKGKDKQNNLYHWEIREWTTLLLTRVN